MPTTPNLQNVVVVRFSIKVAEWRRRAFVNERNREPWFAYRARLFRQTLYASLLAQSKPVQALYLLMDEDDPALFEKYQHEWMAQTESLALGNCSAPEIRPIFSSQSPHEKVALDLLKRGQTQHVTVSRIDSDDIVARDFFEKLSQDISDALQRGDVFDYVMAAQGYKSNLRQTQRCLYGRSPFLTRYWSQFPHPSQWPSADEPPTVYDVSHVRIREYRLLESLNAQWMQLLHGTNVANGFSKSYAHVLPQDLTFLNEPNAPPILCEAKQPFDSSWFRAWAGFEAPDLGLFAEAPLPSAWDRFRVVWRRLKGRQ